MSSWTPILRHCVALPNLTEDSFVCQMPEYGQKRICPPGPQFWGTVYLKYTQYLAPFLMACSRLALLPVRSDRKICCRKCWKLKIGENIFEDTQVKFEEDLGQKIIQKESYREIKLKFFWNNNNGGSWQSVGGAQSGIGPIEVSVCIVLTNQKPSWREQLAWDKSLMRCTFEKVLTRKEISNSKTKK